MSAFVKLARICLLITATCCASTFADERPNPLLLTVEAHNDGTTVDQAAIENEWEYRAAPLPASLTVSVTKPNQEPTTVEPEEPESIWQYMATAILGKTTAKWTELQSRILADKEMVAGCRSGERSCPAAARRFLAIVEVARQRQGRARLGEINRAINMSIRPMSDMTQYGVDDYWASPLTSLGNGAGDCKDYAIAKYVALEESGVSPDDLQLEIVRDVEHQATHAVVAVRFKDEWLILDNRTLLMLNADASSYRYLVALDHSGARTFATEVERRRTVQTGVPVSYLHDDQATTISANLAMTNGLQKVD